MQGKQIKTLNQLYKAAIEKKAVFCPTARGFDTHIPAAFIINLQGVKILRLLNLGMFVYKKED